MLQEDCARILLFRGADRSIKNQSGQSALELAMNNGNIQLAEVIDSFSQRAVGKYNSCLLIYRTWFIANFNVIYLFV